jgi:hypothetical protein
MTLWWLGSRGALSADIATRRGQCPCATGQSRHDGWVRVLMMDGRASRSEWPLFGRGCWADLFHTGHDGQWHTRYDR